MRAEILAEMGRSCDATAMLLVARDLDPRPAETADIEKLLAGTGSSCGGGYGWAHVEVEPGSALVSISGVSVPNGRTVGLSVGSHTVEMEAEGFAPLRMELVARSGQATAAKLELPRLPPPEPAGPAGIPDLSPADDAPAAPDVAVEAASAASGAGPIPWILLGAGAGAVVGGVGATLWAIDARSEAERWHDPESPEAAGLTADERRARYNSADDDVGKRRTVSYVLYGVGAASVAAGVAWLIFAPDGEAASAQVTPWLSPGASGISLSGAF